ncbi:GNVR domain-containing protein [Afifella sp. IM 167]|uniref:GNVR domain-containing protein n=1 Tax=Afifella sp. IM 167 TaxID=2033586 RepID=UPI001CD03073|nr:GNVR domain-containing protein [Afifella sp. IM 167]MBZ8133271.1 chromosome partitioning protein ParA [Afifella sp. IM 167]
MLRPIGPDREAQLAANAAATASNAAANEKLIDVDWLLSAARRQMWIVAAFTVLGAIGGLVYALTAVPLYSARMELLIDPRKVTNREEVLRLDQVGMDTAAVENEIQILTSDKIVSTVADDLDLVHDPRFSNSVSDPLTGFVKGAKDWVRERFVDWGWLPHENFSPEESDFRRRREMIETLQETLEVRRAGLSYMLNVSYESAFPEMSAEIVNAFGKAYLSDKLESQFEFTQRANDWLASRVEELRQKASEANANVQDFRTKNGFIEAEGRLVSEQELSELNSQLVLAKAATASARAKHERIQSIVNAGSVDAVVSEALDNRVVNDLRLAYMDAAKREGEISSQLGASHQQAIRLRREMQDYKRLIFSELGRIAESYESDYQVAKSRESALEENLQKLKGVASGTNSQRVRLDELEREATTYQNLYSTFLQRYQEALQRQSFPIVEARIVTPAEKPIYPSYPSKPLILAIGFALGGMIGVGVGGIREMRERTFRTGNQIVDDLNLEYIGSVPIVDLPATTSSGGKAPAIMRYVLDQPLSPFAQTVRSAKVAVDLTVESQSKVIGIISVLPNEGKSTVAKNFASSLAYLGNKALLIDGDLRNPALSRQIAPDSEVGLVETLQEGRLRRDALIFEEESRLAILPTVLRRRTPHTGMLLSSPPMRGILEEARSLFDYVVLDLPPLGPVVDARAATPQIDAFIFVVEWGRTPRQLVRSVLNSNPFIREKCRGVILNKVDIGKRKLYESYGSADYYHGEYGAYYQTG